MKSVAIVSAALLLGSAAAPALAQSHSPTMFYPSMGSGMSTAQSFASNVGGRMTTASQRARQVLSVSAPERIALAEQVGGLIDTGKCRQAAQLALAHSDQTMALRTRQICAAKRFG